MKGQFKMRLLLCKEDAIQFIRNHILKVGSISLEHTGYAQMLTFTIINDKVIVNKRDISILPVSVLCDIADKISAL